VNLEVSLPRADHVLIVARDDLPEDTRLRDAWAARGVAVEQRALPGFAGMLREPHHTVVPHGAIRQISAWIAENAGDRPSPPAPEDDRHRAVRSEQLIASGHGSSADVRESLFGTDTGIFGVTSEPAGGVSASTPTILLANAGATHHIGTNRLYVLLSRVLSHSGFRCLRFDLAGLGDSVIDDAARENHPYPATASADVAAVIAEMERRYGMGTFIVAGLCSGAHTAFHAALDLDRDPSTIRECILINPPTFYYKPGMTLDAQSSNHAKRWQWYRQAIRRPVSWSHLFRGGADISKIAVTAREHLGLVMKARVSALREKSLGGTQSDVAISDLHRDLAALAGSGKRLTFVFSSFDPGHDILMRTSGGLVNRYRREGRIKIWLIKKTNHTFEMRRPRNEMIKTVERHLLANYGGTAVARTRGGIGGSTVEAVS
jgi:hypothetical protein